MVDRGQSFLVIIVLLFFSINPVLTVQAAKVLTDNNALAIGGYDAVSYQNDTAPQMGNPAYSHNWNETKWYFTSAAHRDIFARHPERYAPQYGGYCAFAVSKNSLAPGDPKVWSIVDGKLYLNLNKAVQSMWMSDRQSLIRQADQNWPGLSQ